MHWVSSGTKTLSFVVYDCRGRIISQFTINVGNVPSSLTVSGNTYVCNGAFAQFYANANNVTNLSWDVIPDNNEVISTSGGGVVANVSNLTFNSWHMVQVSGVDCWGSNKFASMSFWTQQCLLGAGTHDREEELHSHKEEQTNLNIWEWREAGISFQLIQRTPDETRAFFQARDFSSSDSNIIAKTCVFQTIVRNDGKQSLSYNLNDWQVKHVYLF